MAGRGQHEEGRTRTRVPSIPVQNLDVPSDVKVISLSEQEFDDLFRQRSRVNGIIQHSEWTDLTPQQQKLLPVRFAFKSPTRQKLFAELTIGIDLAKDDVRQIVSAFKFFPEATGVFAHYTSLGNLGSVEWTEMPYETTPVPLPLVQALLELPHLRTFDIDGGAWSTEAVATLAKHPSLTRIELGRAQIGDVSFSKLARLKSLEELVVVTGLRPGCFLTLAKLPNFRIFGMVGFSQDFNTPIDEETARAIETLDGRLEEFVVDTIGTTVHADIVRALLKVKSLKVLKIDTMGKGLTVADFQPLEGLVNLETLSIASDTYFGGKGEKQARVDAIRTRLHSRIKERTGDPHKQKKS
jgi:hypothetical protein